MIDWQFTIVSIVVVIAAVYTGRAFMRQFGKGEDEAAGCAGCPGSKNSLDRKKSSE
jgi:hypothetical protein